MGEGKRIHCPLQKKYLKKVICVFAQEPYGLLQMLFGIFVRSVEDGLEPSQNYDEVNKLLLLLLLTINKIFDVSFLYILYSKNRNPFMGE